MKSFAPFLFLLLGLSCSTENNTNMQKNEPPQAEEAVAIKKAVDDAYKAISFKPGQVVNFSAIKTYFIPNAQLLNFRNDTLEVMNIDQFVNTYKEFILSDTIKLFYEEEIKGSTDQFGRIAQRMSTYKTYINTMDSVAERGVNSFQLIKTPQGWKVSSIIWDVESNKLRIPDYYLNPAMVK